MVEHIAIGTGKRGTSRVRIVDLGTARLVYVGGQVALDEDGLVIGKDDWRRQCEVVFEAVIDRMSEAGASAADVVKLTCFITSFDEFDVFVEIRRKYLGEAAPVSSAVQVVRLVDPGLLLEVEAVAVIQSPVVVRSS
jgi:enamine deaminase RidA (YjgF/YER057c/UK114 family)